ncbi:MAG TPA: D-alanyl-D-alanine carboxypeptidase [Cyclobacteriaceae bacterium]|nr:D-alanyl-D-alanine carboxypeptidase [Cyclobacteriaceae bacterium]
MGRISVYFLSLLLLSCAPHLKLQKELAETETEFQEHIGLLVYDPEARKTIIEYNSNKYFTPASNTKIFTLLSSLHLIGDSIPAFRYVERNDSLIFWGTGDPSFLYAKVFQNDRAYQFLKDQSSPLYFSSSNFYQEHFGPGWAWDDYNDSYSPERSSFPMYGNNLMITDSAGSIKVDPPLFQDSVKVIEVEEKRRRIHRGINNNLINYYKGYDTSSFTREIPFHVTPSVVTIMLKDTLQRNVTWVDEPMPTSAQILYSIPSDSLYKVMMQESDNFIAEQLLQMCAGIISDSLKTDIAIEYVKNQFLFDLPDEPQWVDGSGLSRYNLFTPRSIVKLWEKIMVLVPKERLFQILAIGGEAGTIKDYYKATPPYIYGKTGTLSNNHCLSGYLITKKGKLLIFSFMNNNYTVPTGDIKKNMESVLHEIHERY